MTSEIRVKKILLLSANPKGTQPLRLGEENRKIKQRLREARERDRFTIDYHPAVRYGDIRQEILYVQPQIVHFSGHGAGQTGLVFEDETGQQKPVNAQALAGLFKLCANEVKCVLLNACYSEIQAKAIAKHIDYVIGMSQEIGDEAAIQFVDGFYDALFNGKPIYKAYEYGVNAIQLASIPEHLTPKLLQRCEGVNLLKPETRKPETEKRREQQTDDLSSQKGIDYTRLRDLLKAGEWKQADKETLAVMLKATGREEEGWLNINSIDNFPCTDLRTIDQLWVKYSNGRFGFSVQKRIYDDVGKDYEKFGDCIEWRVKGNWIAYKDLNFNTTASMGHLPLPLFNNIVYRHLPLPVVTQLLEFNVSLGRFYSSLVSRLVNCNI